MADAGKFNIAITGDSSKFRSELAKTVSEAKGAAGKISGAFRGIQGALAGVGVGLSVAGFTSFIKSSIDALDRLGELSEIAGISATKLGGIAYAAKQSGVEIEQLSKGIKFLNIELAKAQGGDKSSQQLFQRLGIDPTKVKSADDALLKIADSFATYEDGAGKAQLATAAFGKAGTELIPVLNQGGEELRKQIAYYEKYSGVTDELVQKSDEFNDTLDKLSLLSGAFAKSLAAALLPAMQGIANQMVETKEKGDGFKTSAQAVADVLKTIAVGAIYTAAEFRALGTVIGARAAQLAALARLDFTGAGFIGDELAADIKKQYAARDAFIAAINNSQATLDKTGRVKRTGGPAPTLGGAGAGRVKQEVDEFAKQMQRLRELAVQAGQDFNEAFSGEKLSGAAKALERLQTSDVWDKLSASERESIENGYKQIDALEKETDAWKKKREEQEKQIKAYEDIQAAEQKAREQATARIGQFAEQNDEFEKHIAIIGQGQKAYDLLNAELEHNKRLNEAIAAGDIALVDIENAQYERQKKLIDLYHETNEALQQQIEYNRIFADSFSDALVSVVDGTKSVKDAFKDMERSIVSAITRIAAQNIAKELFGVDNQGGGGIGKLLAGIFGSVVTGAAGATPPFFPPGSVPVSFSGGGFGEHFASGGTSRGGWAMVGERGPEIVNLPRGAQVIPNEVLRARRGSVNISNTFVLAGPADRRTQDQIGVRAAASIQRAMRKVG